MTDQASTPVKDNASKAWLPTAMLLGRIVYPTLPKLAMPLDHSDVRFRGASTKNRANRREDVKKARRESDLVNAGHSTQRLNAHHASPPTACIPASFLPHHHVDWKSVKARQHGEGEEVRIDDAIRDSQPVFVLFASLRTGLARLLIQESLIVTLFTFHETDVAACVTQK